MMKRDSMEGRVFRPSSTIAAGRGCPALHWQRVRNDNFLDFCNNQLPLEFLSMTLHRILLAALLLCGIAIAQTAPTLQTRPAAKPAVSSPASASTAGLPTEEAANSFLLQTVCYASTATW